MIIKIKFFINEIYSSLKLKGDNFIIGSKIDKNIHLLVR